MTKTIKTKTKIEPGLKFDIGEEVYFLSDNDDVLNNNAICIFKAKIIYLTIPTAYLGDEAYYMIRYFTEVAAHEPERYFCFASEHTIFKTKDEAVKKAIEMQRLRSHNQNCEDSLKK